MPQNRTIPIWVALGAAILWGVWWMPIRALEAAGLPGLWAGVAMNLGAVPVLIASLFVVRRPADIPARAILGAVFVAGAVTLYSAAITETTVVRAVLLFYLSPAWSVAIECLFFGRRFRWFNAAAFLFALLGVVLIFGGKITFGNWSPGDLMALLSGLSWSVGASLIFTSGGFSVRKLSLIACATAALVGSAAALTFAGLPDLSNLTATAAPLSLGSGTIYLAPILLATLWSARLLPPATITFLLTAEIISGVGTSALFLDEPLGWKELGGALLITLAALIEVLIPAKLNVPARSA